MSKVKVFVVMFVTPAVMVVETIFVIASTTTALLFMTMLFEIVRFVSVLVRVAARKILVPTPVKVRLPVPIALLFPRPRVGLFVDQLVEALTVVPFA